MQAKQTADKEKRKEKVYKARKLIDLVKKNGFYEYFNSKTGKAYGAKNFSWTASLFLDLIFEKNNN